MFATKSIPTYSKILCWSSCRLCSSSDNPKFSRMDQQMTNYTAKDIEFCPNRAKEVMQNYVVETSMQNRNEDPFAEGKEFKSAIPMSDTDHMEAYKANSSVSLYSVMQSNVPEPYARRGKAPTHLNMPGGSNSKDYKYLSGKMQMTHSHNKE